MFSKDDRVRLTRTGTTGTVTGVWGGSAYVKLDSGTQCTFAVTDLERVPVENKQWPPAGLETK